MSNQENIGAPAFAGMEDAWNKAKAEGYTGTFEEFDALCRKAAQEIAGKNEAMDAESMETVAGGGFTSAMKAVGEWCKDNKELLIGTTSAIATAAVGYGVYRYMSGGTGSTGGPAGDAGSVGGPSLSSSVLSYMNQQV